MTSSPSRVPAVLGRVRLRACVGAGVLGPRGVAAHPSVRMGAQVDQLAAELGAAKSTVIADMDQLGIASRAGERLALGR
jgi:hypothetical protein